MSGLVVDKLPFCPLAVIIEIDLRIVVSQTKGTP
jgi:hypothetical protein